MPEELLLADFEPEVTITPSGAEISLGLAHDHVPVKLKFAAGQHAIVCGRDRSGKTSTLRLLAQLLSGQGLQTVALCPGSSALAQEPGLIAWASTADQLLARTETSVRADRPVWLLLDDLASFGSGLDALLSLLLKQASGGFHLVAAATPEVFYARGRDWQERGGQEQGWQEQGWQEQNWPQQVLACQNGILLSPDESDLDLLGVANEPGRDLGSGTNAAFGAGFGPDHKARSPMGRALVVNAGHVQLCQLAKPAPANQTPTNQ